MMVLVISLCFRHLLFIYIYLQCCEPFSQLRRGKKKCTKGKINIYILIYGPSDLYRQNGHPAQNVTYSTSMHILDMQTITCRRCEAGLILFGVSMQLFCWITDLDKHCSVCHVWVCWKHVSLISALILKYAADCCSWTFQT